MNARGSRAYKSVSLNTAQPTRVLDELFARLLMDMSEAAALIDAKEPGGKGRVINHALDIVAELANALDHKAAPEVCANLTRLYDFVRERLVTANRKMETKPINEASRVVTTLREAFQQAVAKI